MFWADSFTTWMLQTMNVWFLRPQKGEQSGSKTTHTSVIRSNATAFNYPSNYRPQYIEVFLQVQLDKTNFIRSTWGIIHSKKHCQKICQWFTQSNNESREKSQYFFFINWFLSFWFLLKPKKPCQFENSDWLCFLQEIEVEKYFCCSFSRKRIYERIL